MGQSEIPTKFLAGDHLFLQILLYLACSRYRISGESHGPPFQAWR